MLYKYLRVAILILIGVYLKAQNTDGLIFSGHIDSSKSWLFLGKFCFISEHGKVVWSIDYPAAYGVLNLNFYYDLEWPSVYPKKGMSCDNKEHQISLYRILNLTTANDFNGCVLDNSNLNDKRIKCQSSRRFIGSRPRYWFMVISNCYPEANYDGIKMGYRFEFTNGLGTFDKHFSADEFGILETSIAMFIVYFLMVLVVCLYSRILYKKHLLHGTFKLFVATVVIQFVSYLFFLSEYAQFSSSGMPTPGMLYFGRFFNEIATTTFLLMLILIGKGYTVTRGRLRKNTWIKIVVVFVLYVIAIVIVFLYSEILFDDGIVNYFYKSPGGISLITIRLVMGWLWFCYAIYFTLKNYPEKRKFYIMFLTIFTVWFWASPITILASSIFIDDHVRKFVAFIAQSLISFLAHFVFLILTRPTAENKTFPYHFKTNSVGLLKNNSTDGPMNYPHHKIDNGGNTEFDGAVNTNSIASLFQTESSKKYVVDDEVTN